MTIKCIEQFNMSCEKITKFKKMISKWEKVNFCFDGPFQISLLKSPQCLGWKMPTSLGSITLHTALAPDVWREDTRLCFIPEDVHNMFHPFLLWICTHSQPSLCVKAEKSEN